MKRLLSGYSGLGLPQSRGIQIHHAGQKSRNASLQPDHNMSDQRQKKHPFLSVLSSSIRTLRNRPPLPSNAVEDGVPSGSARIPSSPPFFTESVPGTSRTVNGDFQVVNESRHHRPHQTIADPQRNTALISGVGQLQITGGAFNQINNIYHDVDDPLKHVAFQLLPRSHHAAYNAAINFDNLSRRRCTDGTRVGIIKEIMAWVNENDPAKAPPVYWLTGLAGLGKTTIAYSICERLEKAHLPFASFFCSLQLDSKDSKLLVTTLCRDLAELYSSYAASVLPTLAKNAKVAHAGLRVQIDQMLATPWQASIGQGQNRDLPMPIVVVDALDECDKGTEFLEQLLCVIRANELTGIKFLVTSRLDPKIVNICDTFPPNAICKLHKVDPSDVQSDIEKYLREALPELKDEPELALLSKQAGGLFIYATTAVRFISPLNSPQSVSEMRSHLQVMLNPGSLASHADSDERLLVDELYERILGDAFQVARIRDTRLRILHTIVCAESRIDISVLADLANTDQGTVKRVVESLHAVLFISSKDNCVYWYHASFPDFVFSRARAWINLSHHGNHRPLEFGVFCDPSVHHGVLALRCLSNMHKSLHFNMCNLPSSYLFDSEVPGLNESIDKTFSLTLQYTSRQWARHLFRAAPAEDDADELLFNLKDFMDNKLLFWMEAMNHIDAKFECSSLLKDARSWVERGKKCQPDLLEQLTDAIDFATFFAASEASKSTPHLYISALSTWHQDSPIWKFWKNRFAFIPSILLSRAITISLLNISTTYPIHSMALSSDGNLIVSSSFMVWDVKTGKLLREPRGHTDSVTSLAFSPDGNLIVSGSLFKSMWGSDATSKQMEQGHRSEDVGYLPDGNRLVSGYSDKSVRVWETKTGKQLRELQGHTKAVSSVAFSPDGNRIVSGSCDKSVRVWDAKTGNQLRELRGHADDVTSVAFSSDGNRIVSGSFDQSVRMWDAMTGEQLWELQGHTKTIISVALSPDSNRIVSGSFAEVGMCNAKTGEKLRDLQGHTSTVASVAFSPDGNLIVSGSWDRSVRVWNAKTGEQLTELQGHTARVTSVAFLPDGNRVISGSEDRSVRMWDAKPSERLRELQGHIWKVHSVAFSPDGNRIASVCSGGSVRVWDAKTGEQLRELQGYSCVAFSPVGNKIVSGFLDNSVLVWDAKTGIQLRELRGHADSVTSVAFSSDGNRIVSGSRDKSVRVWDAKTGNQLRELRGHADDVTSVAFSSDSNRIVCGSEDKLWVWDAKTGELLRELQGHTHLVNSVAFSPDSNRIVSGSYDGSVRVWDAKTGEWLRELRGHNHWVTSVAFSPDGNRIVSGSCDESVRVWDAKTGDQLRKLQGHTDFVWSVAFSPDSNRIVSGSSDQSVRVWANLNIDAPWVRGEDGWILSGTGRLLCVPSSICNVLLHPFNTLIISRNGSATISFAQCKLGALWHECYTP